MPRTIQHILLDLEVAPPAAAWQQLTARLSQEFDPAESKASEKLSGLEIMPPASAWQNIALKLEVEETPVTPVIPISPAGSKRFPVRRLAIAAAITGVLFLAGWYLLGTNDESPQPSASLNKEVPPTNNITEIRTPPPVKQESSNNLPEPAFERPVPNKNRELNTSRNEGIIAEVPATDIESTNPHSIQPETTTETAEVPAPPIRDKSGQLVMDLKLLMASGNNYFTVTGPNGEQTRLSRKFLPLLLNLGTTNGSHNEQLRSRLREWSQKLMLQASFAPSATNFLDIMELKELIEEK